MKLTTVDVPSEVLTQIRADEGPDGEIWLHARKTGSPNFSLLAIFTSSGHLKLINAAIKDAGFEIVDGDLPEDTALLEKVRRSTPDQ